MRVFKFLEITIKPKFKSFVHAIQDMILLSPPKFSKLGMANPIILITHLNHACAWSKFENKFKHNLKPNHACMYITSTSSSFSLKNGIQHPKGVAQAPPT
jgi:hypothetical protein